MSTFAETFRADFRASAATSVLGSITAVIGTSIRHTARLSLMGDWSFQIPQAAYDDTLVVNGYYVELYSLIGASAVKEFSGYITSIDEDWRPPSQGVNTLTLRGKDDLWELRQKVIRQGEIYDTGTIIPIYAGTQAGVDGRGATDTLPNLIDNNAATGETFALYDPFLPATTGSGDPSIIYIGNDAPFDLVTLDFDVSGTNSKTGLLVTQIYKVGRDFTGWDTVAITDTTTAAGVPFAQDGSISWAKEPAEKQELHDGRSLYFVRMFITQLATIGRTDTMDIRGVTVRSWIASGTEVQTLVEDAAYGNWSLHASSETGTQEGFVVTLYGDSVLNALFDLAERSGESFALTDSQEIRWIDPANPPSSGITAVSSTADGSGSSYCYITSMSRKREYREIIKTIIPRGGGDDEVSAVTLANLEADPATSYTDYFFTLPSGYTVDTVGGVPVSITNGNLSSAYDEAIEYVDFPNISALRGGTGPNRQTADELAKAAIAYLQNHASESRYYNARVAGLDWTAGAVYPGMTMTVSAEITAQDGTATETINESLVIIEMTRTFNRDGARFFDIKFGNKQQIEPTPLFQNAKRSFKTKQKLRHPQPASVSKLHGASNSIGAGVANPTPVGVHDVESVYHTTTMADGSVLGSDGTVPTEITFGTGFSFNSTTNEYTVNGSAITTVDHDNLTNVTADQHHNQQHGIVSSDHTVTGAQYSVVGLSSTDTLGVLPTSADGSANFNTIVRSDSSGRIKMAGYTVSEDGYIGNSASTERIEFDGSNNRLEVHGADLQIVGNDVTFSSDGVSEIGSSANRAANVHSDAIDLNGVNVTSDGSTVDIDGSLTAGAATVNSLRAAGGGMEVRGSVVGTTATAFVEFEDSAGTRFGYVGNGSGSNGDIYMFADTGNQLRFFANATQRMRINSGVVVGAPTGDDKGPGTINAQAMYDDNSLLSDFLWDLYYDGEMSVKDAALFPNARLWTIDQIMDFTKRNRHLPTMPSREEWESGGKKSLGELVTGLWQTVEILQMQIAELKDKYENGNPETNNN